MAFLAVQKKHQKKPEPPTPCPEPITHPLTWTIPSPLQENKPPPLVGERVGSFGEDGWWFSWAGGWGVGLGVVLSQGDVVVQIRGRVLIQVKGVAGSGAFW